MTWFEFRYVQDRMHGVGQNRQPDSEGDDESDSESSVVSVANSIQMRVRTIAPEPDAEVVVGETGQ